MTQITAALSHPAAATVEPPARLPWQPPVMPDPAGLPLTRRDGPLRSGNPRGNPNLAPRCGAKARTTGCPCRAPAMPNGRCRMHGGKSTGPRTPQGLADLAKARTTHGNHTAAERAMHRHAWTVIRRNQVLAAADGLWAYLPAEIRTRVEQGSKELVAPPDPAQASAAPIPTQPPSGASDHAPARAAAPTNTGRDARGRFAPRPKPALCGRRAELEAARAERAMLAPWRAGIKRARLVKRLLTLQARNARRAQRAQTPRIANLRIYPMNPGAGPSPTGLGEAANKTSIQRGTGGETAAPHARTACIANPRTNPMDPRAASSPTSPNEGADKRPMQRGTVPPVAKPFRWGCWAAPPPSIRRCQSWRRSSRPPPSDRR